MKEIERTIAPANNRLKIVSLTHKPDNWTGKTWTLQQGYLQSSGSILLLTDADTYYSSKDTAIYLYVYATIFSSIRLSSYIIFRHSILYYANY
jgi:hypothetical protein